MLVWFCKLSLLFCLFCTVFHFFNEVVKIILSHKPKKMFFISFLWSYSGSEALTWLCFFFLLTAFKTAKTETITNEHPRHYIFLRELLTPLSITIRNINITNGYIGAFSCLTTEAFSDWHKPSPQKMILPKLSDSMALTCHYILYNLQFTAN